MALSKELQLGKAGEHLVCFDLIMQGHSAFLADQGLPFDILVDIRGQLKKVQTRSTTGLRSYTTQTNIYRFGTRRGKNSKTLPRAHDPDVDYYAFVSLDTKQVAYVPIKEMIARTGKVKQTVDFKSRRIKYRGRIYSNGTKRTPEWGRYFEDYAKIERR